MSEEEKKAIEYIENEVLECDVEYKRLGYETELYEGDKPIPYNEYKTILNIIKKQQKEIEELTKITKTYNAFPCNKKNQIIIADKEYFDRGLFVKRYISKDEIKEKIKELENYTYMSNEEMKQQDYAIVKIEELLEE